MIVQLGEQVMGKDGKLGELHGFNIDPNTQTADQMVIKHGVLGTDERLAVLGHVVGVETGIVRVDLETKDLNNLDQYNPGAFRSRHSDFGGPSMFDLPGDAIRDPGMGQGLPSEVEEQPTNEPMNDTHSMTPEYPSTEDIAPEDVRPTVISEGAPVWDNNGEKIGEVHDFAVETTTGRPTRITLTRGGVLSQSEIELPLAWIERFGPKGIALQVSKGQVEGLGKSNP